jgi:hypothetical protein
MKWISCRIKWTSWQMKRMNPRIKWYLLKKYRFRTGLAVVPSLGGD